MKTYFVNYLDENRSHRLLVIGALDFKHCFDAATEALKAVNECYLIVSITISPE